MIHKGLVLYQLIKLWQSSKHITWLMALGFVTVHSVTIIYGGITVIQLSSECNSCCKTILS